MISNEGTIGCHAVYYDTIRDRNYTSICNGLNRYLKLHQEDLKYFIDTGGLIDTEKGTRIMGPKDMNSIYNNSYYRGHVFYKGLRTVCLFSDVREVHLLDKNTNHNSIRTDHTRKNIIPIRQQVKRGAQILL